MMPDGLNYVSSWIDHDFKVCYQLMETNDFALFDRWTRELERSDGIRNCAGPVFGGSVSNYCARKRVTKLKGYKLKR